jgi:hypothetical protein
LSPEKLAYMANQIGKFFAQQKHDQAVASIAGHLWQFWDPRMRREILRISTIPRSVLIRRCARRRIGCIRRRCRRTALAAAVSTTLALAI